ncbi:MAG: ABC transporter substrate-binding protein [Ignavibacteriae bacterium HGW-Ignavibacteriae-2]|jgi:phospholipid/cholesterol/gamma-HCH transport system substrate-binding protein|nr:MAG: ABC transporter substrate-binding protein [Ignavibacteriae bacterium HGW-Ignavibacteriae-2]
MNKEKKTEVKVGLMVILGIVLFLWILGWSKNFSLSEKYQYLNVEFNSVAGLSEGDVVSINGVKKGYVDEIKLTRNTAVAKLRIEKDITLYEDASFSVMMLDLMGGKKVEIHPGNSEKIIDVNILHKGQFLGDIASAMAALSGVQTDIIVLIKEVKDAVTNLNNSFLSENFVTEIRKNLKDLNSLVNTANSVIKNNESGISNLINNSNKLVSKGNDLLDKNETDITSSISSLKELLNKSKLLVTNINQFAEEVRAQKNNVGKIIYDEQFLKDIKETLLQTNQLIKILLEQIQKDGINVDANIF